MSEELGVSSVPTGSSAELQPAKPPPVYVPPRIDPDLYQADVPDWIPQKKGSTSSKGDGSENKLICKPSFTMQNNEKVIEEFLAVVRNLLEWTYPSPSQEFWSRSQTRWLPLESDALSLEYLASYDYDINRALFNLYLDLSCGKDAIFTGKSQSVAERSASNVIFSDCRDRLLSRMPPYPLFGSYPFLHPNSSTMSTMTMMMSKRAGGGDREESASSNSATAGDGGGSTLVAPSLYSPVVVAAPAATEGVSVSLSAPQPQGDTSTSREQRGPGIAAPCASSVDVDATVRDSYMLFSHLVVHPKHLPSQTPTHLLIPAAGATATATGAGTDTSAERDRSNSTSSSNGIGAVTKRGGGSGKGTKSSLNTDAAATSGAAAAAAGGGGRVSKSRNIASNDKIELRRKWLSIAQRAAAILAQKPPPSKAVSTGESASTLPSSDISSDSSTTSSINTLVYVQQLLDEASALPPLSSSAMAAGGGGGGAGSGGVGKGMLSGSTAASLSAAVVAAATEEATLLDTCATMLGKLIKQMLQTRYWIAEVRDSIYCSTMNARIWSTSAAGDARRGGGGSAKAATSSTAPDEASGSSAAPTTAAAAGGGGGGSGGGAYRAERVIGGMKELQKEAQSLPVRATVEESQLDQVISCSEKLLKRCRGVLDVCCAWERKKRVAASSRDGVGIPTLPPLLMADSAGATQRSSSSSNTTGAGHNGTSSSDTQFHRRSRPAAHSVDEIVSLLLLACPDTPSDSLSSSSLSSSSSSSSSSSIGGSGKGKAVGKNNGSSGASRITMEEAAALLHEAELNPLSITELPYIVDVFHQGLRLATAAETVLSRAAQLSVAKSRLTLDRPRYPLSDVHGLLLFMHAFPFHCREVTALQALVDRTEAWRKEVNSLATPAAPATVAATDTGTAVASNTSNNQAKSKRGSSGVNPPSQAPSSKPIPLKKVEALLAEGERLPFQLQEEILILKEKKQQAKLWLEKLKKSFVPTKVAASRSSKKSGSSAGGAASAGGDGTGAVEKISLSDMKTMVSEGESLYQQQPFAVLPHEDDGDLAGIPRHYHDTTEYGVASIRSAIAAGSATGGGGGGGSSNRTVNRDLDRACAVVETAEDWISRARELLLGESEGEDEGESRQQQTTASEGGGREGAAIMDVEGGGKTKEEPKKAQDEEEEEEEDEDEEENIENTIQVLKQMLDEVDSMPVTLDEAGALRGHLHALQWALKVRPHLPLSTSSTQHSSTAAASHKTPKKPKLSEMQQFAKEITRIRAAINSASGNSGLPLKPLAEEVKCLALVSEAEKWLNKVKKIVSGNVVRQGTKLSRLRLLFAEGAALPVNFDYEMRPLKSAITAVDQWMEEYSDSLVSLGLSSTPADTAAGGGETLEENLSLGEGQGSKDGEANSPAAAAGGGGGTSTGLISDATAAATTATSAAATGVDEAKVDAASSTSPLLYYSDLLRIATSAANLTAEFDAARSVQDLLHNVEQWLHKVNRLCRVAEGPLLGAAAGVLGGAGGLSRKRRKTFAATTVGARKQRKEIGTAAAGDSEDALMDTSCSSAEDADTAAVPDAVEVGEGDEEKQVDAEVAVDSHADSGIPTLMPVSFVDELIQTADTFSINLTAEVEKLIEVKEKAIAWEKEAAKFFTHSFRGTMTTLFSEYFQLILRNCSSTTPANGTSTAVNTSSCIFDFIYFPKVEEEEEKASIAAAAAGGGGVAPSSGPSKSIIKDMRPNPPQQQQQQRSQPSSSTLIDASKEEEGALFQRVLTLYEEVQGVCGEGEAIGVEMPVHRLVRVYVGLLEWLIESRDVCCKHRVSRRRYSSSSPNADSRRDIGKASSARDSYGGSAAGFVKKIAMNKCWQGWQDIVEPQDLPYWGDIDVDLVLTLISEGASFLRTVPPSSTPAATSPAAAAALKDTEEEYRAVVAQYKNTTISSAALEVGESNPDGIVSNGNGGGAEEEEEEGEEDEEGEGGDVDEEDDDNQDGGSQQQGPAKKKTKIEAGSSSVMSSSSYSSSLSPNAATKSSTRAASGIVRKKHMLDYGATSKQQQGQHTSPTAAGASSTNKPSAQDMAIAASVADNNTAVTGAVNGKGSSRKRQRGTIAGDDINQHDGESLSTQQQLLNDDDDKDAIEVDISKMVRRAELHHTFSYMQQEQQPQQSSNSAIAVPGMSIASMEGASGVTVVLTPPMTYFIDLWMRILKAYARRMKGVTAWAVQARTILVGIDAANGTTASNGGGGGDGVHAVDAHPATTVNIVIKSSTGDEIESLLAKAKEKDYQLRERTQLEEVIQQSKAWLLKAAQLRGVTSTTLGTGSSSTVLLDIEELKQFLKAGERVVYYHERNTEIRDLKAELKKAQQWKTRLDKSGFDSATASAEVLSALVEEAKTIRVDLSAHTESILHVNKTYCLCRQLYHGQMVGCDTCEEWYHFQCVGLSVSQAEKCAKYVCVRCALKNSFHQSAQMVAQLTNKWMNFVEHFRKREETFQKLSKRMQKEEKELMKANMNLKALAVTTTTSAASSSSSSSSSSSLSSSSAMDVEEDGADAGVKAAEGASKQEEDGGHEGAVAPAAAVAFTANADKINAAQREVDQISICIAKSMVEKDKLVKTIALETQLHREIFRWMQAMQELLWPSTEEQVVLGQPLGPVGDEALHSVLLRSGGATNPSPSPTSSSSSSGGGGENAATTAPTGRGTGTVLEYNRYLLSHLPSLLPIGLVHMERAAALVGILSLDDVVIVLEAFRWMSWVNLCLHMLRLPPTTAALRRLLDVTRGMRCTDDKIIKLLTSVLQRSGAWKTKARKTLNSQQKKLDLGRFQNLALEGNSLPFTSRIKDKLKAIIATHPYAWQQPAAPGPGAAAAATGDGGSSSGAGGATGSSSAAAAVATTSGKGGSKRGPKPNPHPAGTPGNSGAGSSESWATKIANSGVEQCVSSDEEDAFEQCQLQKHQLLLLDQQLKQQQKEMNAEEAGAGAGVGVIVEAAGEREPNDDAAGVSDRRSSIVMLQQQFLAQQQQAAAAESRSLRVYVHEYAPIQAHAIAQAPDTMWPPVLTIARRRPPITPAAAAATQSPTAGAPVAPGAPGGGATVSSSSSSATAAADPDAKGKKISPVSTLAISSTTSAARNSADAAADADSALGTSKMKE